jgi:hypothetical protein
LTTSDVKSNIALFTNQTISRLIPK